MAKQKETKKTYKVKFIKPFEGSLNNFRIQITKNDIGTEMELPKEVHDWIQKFKVTQ